MAERTRSQGPSDSSSRASTIRAAASMRTAPASGGTAITGARACTPRTDPPTRGPPELAHRNYVGTILGGAMYAAVDPFYMIMLIKLLGPGYIVWDKAAAIRFRRPGTTTLEARCAVDPAVLEGIRAS